MAQNLEITMLLDFYGSMLTEKQHDFLSLYYNEDLSLAEIAANEGITRQGVRDAIKRAEAQLIDIENKLGFAKTYRDASEKISELYSVVGDIEKYNTFHGMSKELNEKTKKLRKLLEQLSAAD